VLTLIICSFAPLVPLSCLFPLSLPLAPWSFCNTGQHQSHFDQTTPSSTESTTAIKPLTAVFTPLAAPLFLLSPLCPPSLLAHTHNSPPSSPWLIFTPIHHPWHTLFADGMQNTIFLHCLQAPCQLQTLPPPQDHWQAYAAPHPPLPHFLPLDEFSFSRLLG